MKISKRLIRIAAIPAALALMLTGCTNNDGSASSSDRGNGDIEGMRIAYAMPTSAGQLFVDQAQNFKEMAEALGASVELYDNNSDSVTMLSNADLMVAEAPDFIVEYPPVADATDRVGQKFTDAGIPCIAINVPVEGCYLLNVDQKYQAEVGAQAMADELEERGWDGSNTTVLIGQASDMGPDFNIAVQVFYSELSKVVPGMTPTEVDEITPTTTTINGNEGLQADLGLTPDQAYEATRAAIQSIPNDRNVVLYSLGDDATTGSLRAIENAGRLESAVVSGYGGNLDALNLVRDNESIWVTEQMSFFKHWGQFALAMMVAIETGTEPPELTAPPMVALNSENIDEYFEPGTDQVVMMPPLPESSEYLIETGVLQKFGNVEGALE